MSWRLRICGPDLYHHIFVWGNDRHSIFREERHYEYYLQSLEKYSEIFAVDIIAYALMEWHVHLFVYDRDNKVSSFMERLHGDYAQFFNKDVDHVGHVFGERFNNKIVQPNIYALRLSKYIHRQAVEAGLVNHPLRYRWTSYRIYCGLEKSKFLKPGIILEQLSDKMDRNKEYASMVLNREDDPVDWEQAKLFVVGDKEFKAYITEKYLKNNKKKKCSIPSGDVLRSACDKFKISKNILLNPCGQYQRELRHQVILFLIKEQGLNQTQVARLLRISRLAVINVLKKNVRD
jgi:REP element-mobilizing transposase RayT